MMWLLVVSLVFHLDAPTEVRLVHEGIDAADWSHENATFTTHERVPVHLHLDAGYHEISSTSSPRERWSALLRPADSAEGFTWSIYEVHTPQPMPAKRSPIGLESLLLLCVLCVAWGRRRPTSSKCAPT